MIRSLTCQYGTDNATREPSNKDKILLETSCS